MRDAWSAVIIRGQDSLYASEPVMEICRGNISSDIKQEASRALRKNMKIFRKKGGQGMRRKRPRREEALEDSTTHLRDSQKTIGLLAEMRIHR